MINQYFQPETFKHFYEGGTNFTKILKPYSDINAPAFFFSTRSIEQIMLNHKGPAVIIVNNDTRPIQRNLDWVRNRKNLYFISTSKLMSVYLDGLGLRYVEFPWSVIDLKKAIPSPKGNSVYFYGEGPHNNLYGYHIFSKIIKQHFPHLNIIYACYKPAPPFTNYTKEQLNEVYKNVFVSVRLTRFDGLSGTVQGLGIRGIKTIWNGGTPSALSYGSEQDIINHIRNEEKTIGFNDIELSNICKKYLDPINPAYEYVFDIKTYSEYRNTPKLFINDKPLTFQDYGNVVEHRHDMNQKLTI